MRISLTVIALGVAAAAFSARWCLQADDTIGKPSGEAAAPKLEKPKEAAGSQVEIVSVQDALERPFILPFAEPTTLAEVCKHLRRVLDAPVVLDLAALKRLELTPEERVQLDLHGVRLKTGLKLLLDQVAMTYRVVPEDNLLILTDTQGSDDPLNRVLSELKSLHRDIHELQDAVDEIQSTIGAAEDDGRKMRKPTIIEELPNEPGAKPAAPPATSPSRPRSGI